MEGISSKILAQDCQSPRKDKLPLPQFLFPAEEKPSGSWWHGVQVPSPTSLTHFCPKQLIHFQSSPAPICLAVLGQNESRAWGQLLGEPNQQSCLRTLQCSLQSLQCCHKHTRSNSFSFYTDRYRVAQMWMSLVLEAETGGGPIRTVSTQPCVRREAPCSGQLTERCSCSCMGCLPAWNSVLEPCSPAFGPPLCSGDPRENCPCFWD